MKIGFYNYYDVYNNNRMLKDPSSTIGDEGLFPIFYLGKELKSLGYDVCTIDTEKSFFSYDAIIFIDFPGLDNSYFKRLLDHKFQNLYLIILEPIMTKPDNWYLENHRYFKKIFTWNDKYIDNKKYFKINYSFDVSKIRKFNIEEKKKLCTLIACNKFSENPIELYSERLNAIKWFEKYHPEDFDLYGIGWSKYIFKKGLYKLNKYLILRNIVNVKRPSYRGAILNKSKILSQYKFSICYENEKGIPGYITEKIFDCFFAGNIPIYLGAPNIEKHIPKNTFIDKREFKNYDEVYKFIESMDKKSYLLYIDAISDFINTDKIKEFSAEYFSDTIIREVLENI